MKETENTPKLCNSEYFLIKGVNEYSTERTVFHSLGLISHLHLMVKVF